jgi:hypothetical protein
MLDAATKERIDADIASEDVVLFMKAPLYSRNVDFLPPLLAC